MLFIIANNYYVVLYFLCRLIQSMTMMTITLRPGNTKAKDTCKAKDVLKTEVIDVDRLPDNHEETDYYQ